MTYQKYKSRLNNGKQDADYRTPFQRIKKALHKNSPLRFHI